MPPDILPFVNLGATGLLALVLYYLIRILAKGDWIPKQIVDTLLAARDAEIVRSHERAGQAWSAFESERHVSELVRQQNRELIEVARTVEHVLESLQLVVERRNSGAPPP